MISPNPAGRPVGLLDRRQKLNKALLDSASEIAQLVVDKALEGDMHAASIVLARVAPALKPQAERVQFDLDASAPLTDQAEAVVQAIASGDLAADTAKMIIDAIAALGAIRQLDEMEQRLQKLERRAA